MLNKKIRQIHFVLMSENGTTLLEALLAMIVLMVIVLLLCTMLVVIKDNKEDYKHKNQELQLQNQIHRELLMTNQISIKNGLMLDVYGPDVIKYELDDDKLIRKVNNSGYQVYLDDVKDIDFILDKKEVWVNITYTNDTTSKILLGKAINV